MYSYGYYKLFVFVFVGVFTIDFGEAYLRNTIIVTPAPSKNTSSASNDDNGRFKDLAETSETSGSSDSVLVAKVGSNVKTQAYDPMMYTGSSGGPVSGPDDLECQAGRICCWENGDNSSGTTLQWRTGHGSVDKDKLNANFDTQTTPEDYYLIAFSKGKKAPSERALFESCSINCAEGNIEVKFRYWTTPGVSMQVCTRDAFFGDTKSLSNCRDAMASSKKQSGQAQVNLDGGSLLTLDIVASGFTADSGSVAIVDHIMVSFKPCQQANRGDSGKGSQPASEKATSSGQPKTTSTSNSANNNQQESSTTMEPGENQKGRSSNDNTKICRSVSCHFTQDNMCGYKEYRLTRSSPLHATKGFAVRHGRFDNFLTGVQPPPDGSPYAAAYLYGGDNVALQTEQLKLSDSMVLRFSSYIAAQGLRIKVCLNTENNCPLTTAGDVNVAARKRWTNHSVLLPKDTVQIFFVAENSGLNQGGVGIGNLQLLLPSKDGDPQQASDPACGNTRSRRW